jgi:hypothetical protein
MLFRRHIVRRTILSLTAGLALSSLMGLAFVRATEFRPHDPQGKAPSPAKPAGKDQSEGGCHGTSIDFVGTPSEAAREAKKQEKLVFVLHVSGNFEDPRFT